MYEIYTDGSCLGNPGPGGWAYLIKKDGNQINEKSGLEPDTTNNRMEMTAAIEALCDYICNFSTEKVILYTDSTYLKNGITKWIKNWKKNNWKTTAKTPIKNKDLWLLLDQLNDKIEIEWKWVKAHASNLDNNRVDMLARAKIKK